ncbi:hypothetical protein [Sphingobacterium sp. LRF_L2]|uniref:hypothetical protein n=1 Tax=Sphingobacterium sp. LRF_L2 TaxID=3369421 RepID=UPI003F62A7DC
MRLVALLILGMTFICSCEKLQFDDASTFTLEEALEITPDYYFKLTSSAFTTAMMWSNDAVSSTTGFGLLADQITTHNTSYRWIDFNLEPRTQLNTSDSYGGTAVMYAPYQYFYQANLDATKVIGGLDAGNVGIDDEGTDRTNEIYAVAHLIKGISQGFLGSTYDRGIIVDQDRGVETAQTYPNSYKELIENAVMHLDQAIHYADLAPSILLQDFNTGIVADKPQFIRYANSLAARFLASIPRDKNESQTLGKAFWNRVLQYAQKGLVEDFTTAPYAGAGTFYNYSTYYLSFLVSGLPYLPADHKLAYLADRTGTYPDEYPSGSTVLSPVETNDSRFNKYFKYYAGFGGYLQANLGRQMFSNYGRIRYGDGANDALYNKRQIIMLVEELRLLRAESLFWSGDLVNAAAELNATSAARIAKGNLSPVPATEAALRYALHYEYAIEIDIAGGNLGPFAFMRRHNLLQPGTPTQFPITQNQLLLTNVTPYSFGGIENAGQKGIWGETATAGLDWGWKGTKVSY